MFPDGRRSSCPTSCSNPLSYLPFPCSPLTRRFTQICIDPTHRCSSVNYYNCMDAGISCCPTPSVLCSPCRANCTEKPLEKPPNPSPPPPEKEPDPIERIDSIPEPAPSETPKMSPKAPPKAKASPSIEVSAKDPPVKSPEILVPRSTLVSQSANSDDVTSEPSSVPGKTNVGVQVQAETADASTDPGPDSSKETGIGEACTDCPPVCSSYPDPCARYSCGSNIRRYACLEPSLSFGTRCTRYSDVIRSARPYSDCGSYFSTKWCPP